MNIKSMINKFGNMKFKTKQESFPVVEIVTEPSPLVDIVNSGPEIVDCGDVLQ